LATANLPNVKIDIFHFSYELCIQVNNGRESTVKRALDGSIYPGKRLVPFSLNHLC
jgi:hypothetical protein